MTTEKMFMGKPCRRGHDGLRYFATLRCVHCNRANMRAAWGKDPAKMADVLARYRAANRAKLVAATKLWREQNYEAFRAMTNAADRQRRRADPIYCMSRRLRARTTAAFRAGGYSKRSRTAEILGCDYSTLAAHIAAQFRDGMSWENRDQWHVDHRTPLAKAQDERELLALCHYTNLQPLWAIDNLKKGAR